MKNKLSDLNDYLFEQLKRLNNEDISADQIDDEVKRAEAIVAVADKVIGNASIQLKAAQLFGEYGSGVVPHLPMIGDASK